MPISSPFQRAGNFLRAIVSTIAISASAGTTGPSVSPDVEPADGPSRLAFLQPVARLYLNWTPDLIRAAEIQAEGGSLMLAADLCDTMMADDRIGGVLDTRTDALLGRDLSFDTGNGRKKHRAVKALDVEADWWAMCPESEVKQLHRWGVMLGLGLAEMQWREDPDHGGRLIPHLDVKNPRWLRFDWMKRKWFLMVAVDGGGQQEIEITPGDGKWILYTPSGRNRPWANGVYRALSRWCLLKRYAIGDWGFYSARHGQGILVATGATGSAEQRKEIAAELRALGRNAVQSLPVGFDLKLVEATAKTWNTFLAQIEAADLACTIAIIGANASTNIAAGDGSKAAATEHGRVALGRTRADAETLATCFHDQLLTWWALYNFGETGLAPWPIWDCTPTEDIKDRAATLQMVGQFLAGVAQNPAVAAVLDAEGLFKQFGIPTRSVLLPTAPPVLENAAYLEAFASIHRALAELTALVAANTNARAESIAA